MAREIRKGKTQMCMCIYLSVPVPLPGTPEWNVRSKYTETHRTVLIHGYGSPPHRTLKYLHCTIYKVYHLLHAEGFFLSERVCV